MPRKTLTRITVSPNRAARSTVLVFMDKPTGRDPVLAAIAELQDDLLQADTDEMDEDDSEYHCDSQQSLALAAELAQLADFDTTQFRTSVKSCGVEVGEFMVEHLEAFA